MNRWTRSQRIRTIGEMPLAIELVEVEQVPLYQRIAPKAEHLSALGLNASRIAHLLHVTDKTEAKALSWHRLVRGQSEG